MKSILLFLLGLTLGMNLLSQTLYVSTVGSDENPGTKALPFGSIQHGLDQTGIDTLVILDGIYTITQPLRIINSGEPERRYVVKAQNRLGAVIDATNYTTEAISGKTPNRSGIGSLHAQGVHYVTLDGLEVKNSRGIGIKIGHGSSHIRLIHCKTVNSFNSGIGLWYCDSVLVTRCEVTGANDPDWRTESDRLGREAPHEALTIAGATHFEVTHNEIHHCIKEGIDCKEVSSHGVIKYNYVHNLPRQGLYVDCWFGMLEDVEFSFNRVHDCEWGMAISGEGKDARMKNIRVHHNLLYDNRGSGVFFGVWGHDEPRDSIFIYNNTIVDNGSKNHWAGPTGGIDIRSKSLTNTYIFNNICHNNYAYEIGSSYRKHKQKKAYQENNVVVTNNHLGDYKSRPRPAGAYGSVYGFRGENVTSGDPMFTDRESFQLKPDSPAAGGGWKEAPLYRVDYLGAVHPTGWIRK